MTLLELKAQIKANKLNNFYIFTGEEIEVQNVYIKHISESSKRSVERAESVVSILNSLKRRNVLNRLKCFVIRDDKQFMQDEALQDAIQSFIGDNILILIYTNLDKRSKFYNRYKDDIVEFNSLEEAVLMKHIKKHIELNQKNCLKLIEVCESSWGRILQEIDKIQTYAELFGMTHDKAFEELLEHGVIYCPPKDAIFDFVDAVLRRQPKRAFSLLSDSYAIGEAKLALLSVLYNNAKQVLQVQSCNSKDVEKSTGLTAWQIKCAREKCGRYSIGELVEMLRLIQAMESGIKSGAVDEEFSVDYILVKFL